MLVSVDQDHLPECAYAGYRSNKDDGWASPACKPHQKSISDALQSLLRDGKLSPSAEELAAKAESSLRTIYRHYGDIEALYRELASHIEAETLPVLIRPYCSTEWRAQMTETVARHVETFERILPLKALLPPDLNDREVLRRALESVASFAMWKRMRYDQGLTPQEAAETLTRIVKPIIAVPG